MVSKLELSVVDEEERKRLGGGVNEGWSKYTVAHRPGCGPTRALLNVNLPDSQGHALELPSTLLHAKLLQLVDNPFLAMLDTVNRHDVDTRGVPSFT